jgi:hypothetical protein
MQSGLFKLNLSDFLKGALVAILTAVIGALYALVQSGTFPTTFAELQPVLVAAVTAFLAYISKNLVTNSQGEVATPEPPK